MKLTHAPSHWMASLLLLVAAGTHVPLIQAHLQEAPYIGWLFIALTAVCIALSATSSFVCSCSAVRTVASTSPRYGR